MKKFHKVLFVSQGVMDETEALTEALTLARGNQAELAILIVCPELPDTLAPYAEGYESSLRAKLQSALQASRQQLGVSEAQLPVAIKFESGPTPALRIVRHVLANDYDLVIKAAEPHDGHAGFKALDMDLLRKCPCPLWLTRPLSRGPGALKFAVAIDPESVGPEGHSLSLRLLTLARALTDSCRGELAIVSCWDYEFEDYLRRSVWVKVPEEEVRRVVAESQSRHQQALNQLIQQAGISGVQAVYHRRGHPEQQIPAFVAEQGIDVLVMGTVARTGIAGFVIGNTAENILQRVRCSLLALKPPGFVSPVKAY